ncbi:5-hydroxytryptamine receptor 1E-like [Lytechinus pictus]|uniref:5-hydroxytryptamine receptor 1E-like n=1 Tax=Lytechinus pictus TaxID=7653 RepID=UPI0030BA05A0
MEHNDDFLPVSLFLSVLLVVGVTANSLALMVIRRFFGNSRRLSVPSVLVQALVIVDLFSTILLVAENVISRWIFPGTALRCNVAYISRLSVAYASGFINASMCLERCLAFRAPFYYHDNATVFKAKITVVIVIGLSVFLSILPLLGVGNYAAETMVTPENATVVVCTPPGELGSQSDLGNRVFTAIYAIVGACMLLIIYVCNTLVMLTLYHLGRKATGLKRLGRSETAAASSPSTSRSFTLAAPKDNMRRQSIDDDTVVSTKDDDNLVKMHPEKSREGIGREIRLAYVVGMISVVFTISWLPFYVQRLLKAFDVEQPDWYLLLVVFLLVSNHVIDPFVFVFMKQQSRDALKDLCMKCICCRRCRPPPMSSRNTVNAHANGNQNRGASRNDSGINNSRNDSGIVVVVDSTPNPTEAPTANPAPDDIHLDLANNRATHSAS